MKPYVKDGTVKEFELWNPSNLGYLAGYAAAALASGTASLTTGSTFTAGTLGTLQGAGARRRHRTVGRARPADRLRRGQHRPVQLLTDRPVGIDRRADRAP